jgi:hypothetical protein
VSEPTIETLPSGEEVQCNADGSKYLIAPAPPTMRQKLTQQLSSNQTGMEEIRAAQQAALAAKQEAEKKGGVPPDKTHC